MRAAGGPVHLLTLGPLTNVASALRDDPGLVEGLAGITIMGGALDVPGNALRNPAAEFNVWVDPVAAEEVIRSGAAITLVPLDATNSAPVTPFFADALARHHPTPEAGTVYELFRRQPYLVEGTYYFWDPLSAAILVDPTLATLEEHRLTVLEGQKETQGRVVDDPDGAPVEVAVGADALAFETEFLNTLNGDHSVTSTRPHPVATITFGETSCSYLGPASLPAELVGVEMDNPTTEPWSALLVPIPQGRTFSDVRALAEGFRPGDEPPTWVKAVGWTTLTPGQRQLAAWTLEPGTYGLVCAGQAEGTIRAVAEIAAG
ncbi:MAG TPA: nucleoside hydrolase [Actinomycetota bacterium]